ncbi:MFS transporter [Patescibacteria group bacterium]|nr:MFS transporter [Patescibacteria group bacterium]
MIQKTAKTFYLVTGLSQFFGAFHYATYVIFLLSRDLDLMQVSLVNVAFMVTVFIFEVPTGAVADIFGRKFSYVLSNLILGLGFAFYGFCQDFWGFILAEIIIAIGMTLTSGALKAWFVDSLKFYGYQGKFHTFFSKQERILHGAGILGVLGGGYLGRLDLAYNWFVSGAGFFIIAYLAFRLMKEEYFRPNGNGWKDSINGFSKITVNSFRYGMGNRSFLLLTIIGLGISIALMGPNMQWQPLFQKFFTDPAVFGWMFVAISLSVMLGNSLVPKLVKNRGNRSWVFVVSLLAIGIGIAVAPWAQGLFVATAFFLFHEMGRGILRPNMEAQLNEVIPSSSRATMLSIYSMIGSGGAALGLLASGFLAKNFSIPLTWTLSAGLIFLLLPVALLLRKEKADP